MARIDYEQLRRVVVRSAAAIGGRWGERLSLFALLAPDLAVLARRVLADRRVAARLRGELVAALLYVASPIDLIPESLFGPAGLIDDATVLSRALDTLLNRVPDAIVREHWPGEPHQLAALRRNARHARRLFGLGAATGLRALWQRGRHALQQRFRRFGRPTRAAPRGLESAPRRA